MTFFRKIWNYFKAHNIFSKVVASILVLIVVFIWTDVVLKYNWLGRTWDGIIWFFGLFTKTFEIPVWGILALVIVPVLGMILLIRYVNNRTANEYLNKIDEKPEYLTKYTEDTLGTQFLIKWNWYKWEGGGYKPWNFTFHCPEHGSLVIDNYCPIDNRYFSGVFTSFDVFQEKILFKVQNNTWREKDPPMKPIGWELPGNKKGTQE